MFQIKICGITSVEDALAVAQAGADAVGLNFYPQSPRCVGMDLAQQIVAALPEGVVKVGLFVNASPREVCQTFDRLGLNLIQLHGDEPPEYLRRLGGRPVMRAFRLAAGQLERVLNYLDQCRRLGCVPRLTLLDAAVPGQYGGTGEVADWDTAKEYCRRPGYPPLVLAGGLTPSNVATSITCTRPTAVDTASGVETVASEGVAVTPGKKDPLLVCAFVEAAKKAFESLPRFGLDR